MQNYYDNNNPMYDQYGYGQAADPYGGAYGAAPNFTSMQNYNFNPQMVPPPPPPQPPMQAAPMYYNQGAPNQYGESYADASNGNNQQHPVDDGEPEDYDEDEEVAMPLRPKKSFSGPETQEERQASLARRRSSMRFQSSRSMRSNNDAAGGLARYGSVYKENRNRATQRSISLRGDMDDDDAVSEDLRQYYGDMASRQGEIIVDGIKAKKSYRGDIEEGDDVGKPRRVTTRRAVNERTSTGYGGINFKRSIAMRKGERWGEMETRTRPGDSDSSSRTKNSRGFNLPNRDVDDEALRRQQQLEQEQEMRRRQQQEEAARRRAEEEWRRHQQQLALAQQQAMIDQQNQMMMMDQPMVPQVFQQEDVQSYSNLSDVFSEDAAVDDRADF